MTTNKWQHKRDEIKTKDGIITVSTLWLSENNFETYVEGGLLDEFEKPYSDPIDAEIGHDLIVDLIRGYYEPS